MRAGLIARAEDRGLGHITWAAAGALPWDRVAVIDYEPRDLSVPNHLDRYPGATRLWCDIWTTGQLDEVAVRGWLEGLDVVYSAETLYDWRLADWARSAGVATVVHGMPEYVRRATLDLPTVWWWPTPWRLDRLPAGPVVPVPVADGLAPLARPADEGELTVTHVLGRRAHHDRNGTGALAGALRRVRSPLTVHVYTQERSLNLSPAANVNLQVHCGGVADRWDMFAGAHLCAMPRRYGGLCLPIQEAMSVGVAGLMPAISANGFWPVHLFDAAPLGVLSLPGGVVETSGVRPEVIAAALDELAEDRALLGSLQERASVWAGEHTWSVLAGRWWAELESAAALLPS